MPTRSKFTSERRARILEILSAGGSRRAAAAVAGIDHATLHRWLERGRKGAPGGRWHTFMRDVEQAETHPALRVLREEYDKLSDSPSVALRFLERNVWAAEDEPAPLAGPVVIRLTLADESPPVLGSGFDGEEMTRPELIDNPEAD
jgi:transposase-like protein